ADADILVDSAGLGSRLRDAVGLRECGNSAAQAAAPERHRRARGTLIVRAHSQIIVLVRIGFEGLLERKWSSLVLVVSVACVVGVLLSMLSVTAGMLRAYRAGEDPGLAIVLSPIDFEYGFGIPANAVGTILDAPGIAKGPDNHPLGDAEVVTWIPPT